MNLMTLLLVAALVGVVTSLAMGIAAMVSKGVVGHRTSAQWMTMRVVLFFLLLL